MPRIGFAGDVILHEPTIGFIEWWNKYGANSTNSEDLRIMTYFFGLANALKLEYLFELKKPDDINKAVKEWMLTINATQAQLWRAMMWVKCGCEEAHIEEQKEIESTIDDEEQMNDLWRVVIQTAGALNKTPDDLKTMTQSTLVETLVEANAHARIPMKLSVAKDYIAYRQLLKKIEERKPKEVSNG